MNHSKTYYIDFCDQQVAVGVTTVRDQQNQDLGWEIESAFGHMLVSECTRLVGRLEVAARGGMFSFTTDRATHIAESNLSEFLFAFRHEVLRQFMKASSDIVWLHGSAVAIDGRSAIFTAPAASGKSTLVTCLCKEQGWSFLSDDVVPLQVPCQSALPFPETPRFREKMGSDSSHAGKTPVDIDSEDICRHPAEVRAIFIPVYRCTGQPELSRENPSSVLSVILQGCQSYVLNPGLAMDSLCELVERVPVYRLVFHDPHAAAELITNTLVQSGPGHARRVSVV